ncbi:MAG: hypothetical protein COS84_05830, partial [Armatimonadetes bacterium CG07_land_8_20_14_0_80_40_9]
MEAGALFNILPEVSSGSTLTTTPVLEMGDVGSLEGEQGSFLQVLNQAILKAQSSKEGEEAQVEIEDSRLKIQDWDEEGKSEVVAFILPDLLKVILQLIEAMENIDKVKSSELKVKSLKEIEGQESRVKGQESSVTSHQSLVNSLKETLSLLQATDKERGNPLEIAGEVASPTARN